MSAETSGSKSPIDFTDTSTGRVLTSMAQDPTMLAAEDQLAKLPSRQSSPESPVEPTLTSEEQ